MKLKLNLLLFIILLVGILAACQPTTKPQPTSASGLPLPALASDAALVNFRALTDSGLAVGAAWAPDGKSLAYSKLSVAPTIYSYRDSNAQPLAQVAVVSKDAKDERVLDKGIALFYSNDGSVIYYEQYDSSGSSEMVRSVNPTTHQSLQYLGTQGFPSVYKLANGQLVLSPLGTYGSQRLYDPANGNRQALMSEHPSISPQDARLSPDGKVFAYPKDQAVYLSKPDGTNAKAISDQGGFGAKVWWSPDSQSLVYTTGNSLSDKLILADRQGETKVVLFPIFTDSGYISTVDWSPDSRWMLVTTDAIQQYTRPSQLYLFDTKGTHKMLLESYETASPAWSPDGHTLALSLTNGPDTDLPVFNIWLADLTDSKTAATLVRPPADPMYQATPTLAVPAADLTPDQVLQNFWKAVDQKEYRLAWGMFTDAKHTSQSFPNFKAFYDCFQQVAVTSVQAVKGDDSQKVFSVKISFTKDPDCNDLWQQATDFYSVLDKAPSAGPWQIECFNNTPDCVVNAP